MEFGYSPHHDGGGTMHLPSPTHRHGYGMDLSSIQQLRRTLSRSPSKPSRFHLRRADPAAAPISPLALSRAFTPRPPPRDHSPGATPPDSPFPLQAATTGGKKRFTLRRSAPFRSSPRTRAKSKSPRRVLTELTDHGNAAPLVAQRPSGDENMAGRRTSSEYSDKLASEQRASLRLDIDDKPIKFGIALSRPDLAAHGTPAKSSPLKRGDGSMSVDVANVDSPLPKRRSLHGVSAFGSDFDVFNQGPTPRTSQEEETRPQDAEVGQPFSFSSPAPRNQSPLRRNSSLRKSTLSQRYGANMPRSKDGEFAVPGLAASKARQRLSLDGLPAFGFSASQTPLRKPAPTDTAMRPPPQPSFRSSLGSHHPHPLSNTLSQSSSSSSISDTSPAPPAPVRPSHKPLFSQSLPLGVSRPFENEPDSSDGTFATPNAFKVVKHDALPFMSTGLLSKKYNRIVDDDSTRYSFQMPGTPSKRNSFPPFTGSPSFEPTPPINRRPVFEKLSQPAFGQPSTPFSVHKPSNSASFGTGVGIFGNLNGKPQRRASFASVDGEDISTSPCGNRQMESQSPGEDLPPTPTKQSDGSGRRKDSSLRRQTFRQQRTSLGADTFSAPEESEAQIIGICTTSANRYSFGSSSPQTPSGAFTPTPPDPSSLSISGPRRGSFNFNSSTNSQFPPATPTGPRGLSTVQRQAEIGGLPDNDVDTSLAERFDRVTLLGEGEFSKVYRVENTSNPGSIFNTATQVWAVKKTKKPYAGPSDRETKRREVQILTALRDHEHILRLENHWERKGHLYIQTEFCEEGNLQRFLSVTGYKARLDAFRIWKILFDLSSGVQFIHQQGYIHLDLKPSNVLITFDGVLKIADFGLASPWPAAKGIDGEGDRRYLAPEALNGVYDKPCDVFTLGCMILEAAANIFVPEGGESWQRLRSGDFSEVPCLTVSSDDSLLRDEYGNIVGSPTKDAESADSSMDTARSPLPLRYCEGSVFPPSFMTDENDPHSIHELIKWMMSQKPEDRPIIEQVFNSYGCQWVARRSRAGATIYEGNWGPEDDVVHIVPDVPDADMMDTS